MRAIKMICESEKKKPFHHKLLGEELQDAEMIHEKNKHEKIWHKYNLLINIYQFIKAVPCKWWAKNFKLVYYINV